MTTPAPPAQLKKRAVRFQRLEINTGTEETPNWVPVRGLTSIPLELSPEEVDTSDFDSDGWSDSLTTFRSWTLNVTGFEGFTGEEASPVEDPGQEALKAAGIATGSDAYVQVRMYRTDNNKGYQGRGSANWSGTGGDVKGVSPFNCNITGAGALTPFTYTPPTP
ncbi:phage tail tube protein [Prauserella endophytica]|uniref:Phage tail protein n=1 Tax=Prauserella endophytica TaxID=1592324 RepID=A0ABY2RZX7_9PSEU|nr:hypothetical protein [Prauserella endophytica]PXY20311.1 hypothetical protein BAY59_31215 [Prauserella coralliicola]TKG66913.1 hypothetical protein FCN18_23660 [Prauserella endophytica]